METTRYEVRFTLTVDRPELRDSTFAPVAPGTKSAQTWTYSTATAAAREFAEMVAGRWDFASEYISSVQVVQVCKSGLKRNFRPWTTRTRVESEIDRKRATLAVGAARRGRSLWTVTLRAA